MEFSIEKKGYCIEEVDSFVEDIVDKYQRLQAQNAELEQKLATAKRLIRRFSDTENALKQNIADSKRAAAYMISDAKDRSSVLLDNARESCGEIISDLDIQIAQKMETVSLMKAEVSAFKEQLFSLYSSHIEMIDTLAQTAEDFEYIPDYTPVADAVDSFEAAGEPDCDVPEFVEYPEESIFTEINEEQEPEATEDFVLDSAEAVKLLENDDEEFAQLAFEEPAAVPAEEITFDISTEKVEEEIEEETEEELAEEIAEEIEEEAAEEAAAEFDIDLSEESDVEEGTDEGDEGMDEDDYFKYLNDFINSDDGLN